ncbi:hypothetical protein JX266_002404 [Neoarthrinium moseri]|nr:hypothetical protein JX266_002404 [Neoarthrinium moseri]
MFALCGSRTPSFPYINSGLREKLGKLSFTVVEMTWPAVFDSCFIKNRTLTYNADIEGPGVVFSFIASGWLTFGIVLCNYLFVFDPQTSPFRPLENDLPTARPLDENADSKWTPNPLDMLISNKCGQLLGPVKVLLGRMMPSSLEAWFEQISTREKAEDAFRQCVMSLCDVQLITGISMLLSGFVSLNDFDYMSLTSWLMVANLAWFSNLTHQCGLVFLRGYLYQNPRERMWKLMLMTGLFLTLVCAWTPMIGAIVFDGYFGAQPTTPAACFYNLEVVHALYADGGINQGSITGAPSFQISAVAIVVLFLSFIVRLIKLFETSSRFVRNRIRTPVSLILRNLLSRIVTSSLTQRQYGAKFQSRVFWFENPFLASYLFLRIAADIFTSVFADVTWLFLSAIFGTKQLAFQRLSLAQLGNDQIKFETGLLAQLSNNRFDFGQTLPLMLLASVMLTTRQAFQAGRRATSSSPDTKRPPFNTTASSRQSSFASTLVAASENVSTIDAILSRDIYLDSAWLVPTVLNIGAAIFLFFQLIASSGGGTAGSLLISMVYSSAIICVACGAIILVGFAVSELRWGAWFIWCIAVLPLAAILWLSAIVMTHGVSFGDREQLLTMVTRLLAFSGILPTQYGVICTVIRCCPNWPQRVFFAATYSFENSNDGASTADREL